MTDNVQMRKKYSPMNIIPKDVEKKDASLVESISSLFSPFQINAGFNFGIGTSMGAGLVGGTLGVIKLGVESYSSATDQTKNIIRALAATAGLLGGIYYWANKNSSEGEK